MSSNANNTMSLHGIPCRTPAIYAMTLCNDILKLCRMSIKENAKATYIYSRINKEKLLPGDMGFNYSSLVKQYYFEKVAYNQDQMLSNLNSSTELLSKIKDLENIATRVKQNNPITEVEKIYIEFILYYFRRSVLLVYMSGIMFDQITNHLFNLATEKKALDRLDDPNFKALPFKKKLNANLVMHIELATYRCKILVFKKQIVEQNKKILDEEINLKTIWNNYDPMLIKIVKDDISVSNTTPMHIV